jgi:hypothetical protein
MEGRDRPIGGERPISKPRFPLPQVFERKTKTPALTVEDVALKDQRAYFYQRDVTDSGTPVYGFFITVDDSERGESH